MRPLLSIAFLGFVALAAKAQDPAPEVRVTGIVHFDARSSVLLEIKPARGGMERPILRVGEITQGVQVVGIDPQQGLVTMKINGTDATFPVDGTPASAVPPTLNIRSADAHQVFDVYQEISSRTVLRAGNLPGAKIDLQMTGELSRPEASHALQKALAEKGIALSGVGEKFACAVRVGDEALVDALPPVPNPSPAPAPAAGQQKLPARADVLPAGMILFR